MAQVNKFLVVLMYCSTSGQNVLTLAIRGTHSLQLRIISFYPNVFITNEHVLI